MGDETGEPQLESFPSGVRGARHLADRTPGRYGAPVDRMPEPGDLISAFSAQPGRCFRMIYDVQLQAEHCRKPLAWKGTCREAKGKSWYVEACREHAPKSAGAQSSEQEDIERSGTD